MKRKLQVISLIIFLTLSSAKLFAQTAAFTFNPQTGCAPLTVQFTDQSTSATSWLWNFGNGNTSVLQNPTEVYSTQGVFIITLSINGGVSTSSDTLVVDSIPISPDTIFGTPSSCIGAGGLAMYYAYPASGSATYAWTVPAGAGIVMGVGTSCVRVLLGATGGNISVTATNDCGTSSTAYVNSTVVGIDTSIISSTGTLTSNSLFSSYQWIECPAMSILPGDTNKTFTPLVSGSYAVIVNLEGCVDTSNCWTVLATGISSPKENESSVTIFPNPTANTFTIKNISSSEVSTLQIINPIGEVVYSEKLFDKKEYLIEKNFAKGIYFVRVNNAVIKLIID